MLTTLIETPEQLEQALASFRQSDGLLAFDTETSGLQVRSQWGDIGRTVQFSWRPWDRAWVLELTPRWKEGIEAFFWHALYLVGHNTKFDAHVMANFGIDIFERLPATAIHDTVFVLRLYDERIGAKLKDSATRFLKEDAGSEQAKLKRAMKKHGWDWGSVPVVELVRYGGTDASLTGRLFDHLYPLIGYAGDAYAREQKLMPILFDMERAGLLVDIDLLNTVVREEAEAMARAEATIQELSPGLNVNAPHQIKLALRKRGHDLTDTTAATLKSLDDELARAILTYRHHKKTHGTYAEPWTQLITPEGRLHPSFNQMGTTTGRFSSSDPNFQNITRGHRLRDCFIAAPGHKFVVADWNQMELRLYAHFAEDENMRAAFLSGDDIYQQAADLLGVPRHVGKMMMLASIYGAGPRTIKAQAIAMAYQNGQPELVDDLETYDWAALHTKFHQQYRIRNLARTTELAARRRGMLGEPYIRTLGGRRQRPKLVKLAPVNGHRQEIEIYKDLANALVQGSSADLMKQALIDVAAAGYGPYLRLTVHDEMVLEVPDDEVEQVSADLKRLMTRSEFVPPLTVQTSSAQRYGEAK